MNQRNNFRNKRILIVDDSKLIQKALFQVAQNADFKDIIIAGDGEEAVELYKKNRPDIVTMDIRMPKKNGIEATQEICEFDKDAKIIMITTVDDPKAVRMSMMKGAAYYVVKPFKGNEVVEVLYKVLFENFTMRDLILRDKEKQERFKYNSETSEYTIEGERENIEQPEAINKTQLIDNLKSIAEILMEIDDSAEDLRLIQDIKGRAKLIGESLNGTVYYAKMEELVHKITNVEKGVVWFSDSFLDECLYILNYVRKGVEEI